MAALVLGLLIASANTSYNSQKSDLEILSGRVVEANHQDREGDGPCGVGMNQIVIDTNVFVAAGFNNRSASARILTGVRKGRFQLIWNKPTRRETETILRRIPRLNWESLADLFRPEGEFVGSINPDASP